MNALDLLRHRVYSLSERLSWLGMSADIPAMTLAELEAAYRFLLRHAGG
jgi:hypothetical protein